ncbi:MAG: TerB family tellurite resistance protein [Anaerolineales bacterium]|jgi:uncharacterized tellurite resistance protein B-like protein
MSRSNLLLALAKVIIAAAWADGEVSNEELNSLKDLLFHLPDITGREWAMLEMYLETPIGPQERERLTLELQEELRSNADKDFAIQALDRLIRADGVVTEREKLIAQEIRQAIDDADSGLFGLMGKLIKGPVNRRKETISAAPNREAYFEDYIKNRVYFGVKVRVDAGEQEVPVGDQELRKLSLAAGLMARVAKIDPEIPDDESRQITDTLSQEWEIDQEAAEFVTEIALAEISPEMDYYRLTRSFFESTSEDERIHFLDVLFSVAAADGFVSSGEIEEIRALSMGFKLPHKTFINAKLKIPREQRAN